MSQYTPCPNPATNNTIRKAHRSGQPFAMRTSRVKDSNGVPTGAFWKMFNTLETGDRYLELFDGPDPPTTECEAMERCGATYYAAWYECEESRHGKSPTVTTDIIFGARAKTEESMRMAEEELAGNILGLCKEQLVEEWKSFEWLKVNTLEEIGRVEREKLNDEVFLKKVSRL